MPTETVCKFRYLLSHTVAHFRFPIFWERQPSLEISGNCINSNTATGNTVQNLQDNNILANLQDNEKGDPITRGFLVDALNLQSKDINGRLDEQDKKIDSRYQKLKKYTKEHITDIEGICDRLDKLETREKELPDLIEKKAQEIAEKKAKEVVETRLNEVFENKLREKSLCSSTSLNYIQVMERSGLEN